MMVVVVGANPSKRNKDPNVPFIGSKSNITLQKWLRALNIDPNVVNVSNRTTEGDSTVKFTNSELSTLLTKVEAAEKVIALGNAASTALRKIGVDHFKLPHPSPRNRMLNNPKLISHIILTCAEWLDDEA